MSTVAQRRAADALARVNELSARPDDEFKRRYRAYVDRLGPAILMNGLGQALATERASAGENPTRIDQRAHHELYLSLHRWLCSDDTVYPGSPDLLQAIMANDESSYVRAQAEALAWLSWHKKFCHAALPRGEDGGSQ